MIKAFTCGWLSSYGTESTNIHSPRDLVDHFLIKYYWAPFYGRSWGDHGRQDKFSVLMEVVV